IRRIGVGLGLATVVTLGIGCTRARVESARTTAATLPRPARIIVFDFDTGAADVRVGSSPRRTARRAVGLYVREAGTLAPGVADTLTTRLVDDMRARGFAAESAAGTVLPGLDDLVIQGQFLRIDEGSQVRRFVIGLGVGATELRTQVEVFQVTREGWRPVQQFDTVAQGSRFPGGGFFVAGGAGGGTRAGAGVVPPGGGGGRGGRAWVV